MRQLFLGFLIAGVVTPVRAQTPTHIQNGGGTLGDYYTLSGDFNGDGLADFATLSAVGGGSWADWAAMELSDGRGGFTSTVWPCKTPGHMRYVRGRTEQFRLVAGDFNGDGRTDIATVSASATHGWREWIAIELSTGSGFSSQTWRTSIPNHMWNGGGDMDAYEVVVGNFNGDAYADIAFVSATAGGSWRDWIAMAISDGKGFYSEFWTASVPAHMRNGGGTMADYRVIAGDFDRNGLTDLAFVSATGGGSWRDGFFMELSTGRGFHSTVWASGIPGDMRNGGGTTEDYAVVAGDFNGDERDDVAVVSATAGGGWRDWIAVALSQGSRFTSQRWASSTPLHMKNSGRRTRAFAVIPGDFTGDGKDDLLVASTREETSMSGWQAFHTLDTSTGTAFRSGTRAWVAKPNVLGSGEGRLHVRFATAYLNRDGKQDLFWLRQTYRQAPQVETYPATMQGRATIGGGIREITGSGNKIRIRAASSQDGYSDQWHEVTVESPTTPVVNRHVFAGGAVLPTGRVGFARGVYAIRGAGSRIEFQVPDASGRAVWSSIDVPGATFSGSFSRSTLTPILRVRGLGGAIEFLVMSGSSATWVRLTVGGVTAVSRQPYGDQPRGHLDVYAERNLLVFRGAEPQLAVIEFQPAGERRLVRLISSGTHVGFKTIPTTGGPEADHFLNLQNISVWGASAVNPNNYPWFALEGGEGGLYVSYGAPNLPWSSWSSLGLTAQRTVQVWRTSRTQQGSYLSP